MNAYHHKLALPNVEFSTLENTIALTTRNLQSAILHSLTLTYLSISSSMRSSLVTPPSRSSPAARSFDLSSSSPHSLTRIHLPSLLRGVPLGPESRYPVVLLAVLCVLSGDAADERVGWKGGRDAWCEIFEI